MHICNEKTSTTSKQLHWHPVGLPVKRPSLGDRRQLLHDVLQLSFRGFLIPGWKRGSGTPPSPSPPRPPLGHLKKNLCFPCSSASFPRTASAAWLTRWYSAEPCGKQPSTSASIPGYWHRRCGQGRPGSGGVPLHFKLVWTETGCGKIAGKLQYLQNCESQSVSNYFLQFFFICDQP